MTGHGTTNIVVNPISIASIICGLFSLAPSVKPAVPLHVTIETVRRQFHCNDDRRRKTKIILFYTHCNNYL